MQALLSCAFSAGMNLCGNKWSCVFQCVAPFGATHFFIYREEINIMTIKEIPEYNDEYLIKQLGLYNIVVKIAYIVVGIFAAICCIIGIIITIQYGLDESWMLFLFPIVTLPIVLPTLVLHTYIKAIKKELKIRHPDDNDKEGINEKINESNRSTAGFAIGIIVMVIIVLLFSIPRSSSRNNNEGGCRQCGSTSSLVPGFGFCSDCYGSFNEWQERTYD